MADHVNDIELISKNKSALIRARALCREFEVSKSIKSLSDLYFCCSVLWSCYNYFFSNDDYDESQRDKIRLLGSITRHLLGNFNRREKHHTIIFHGILIHLLKWSSGIKGIDRGVNIQPLFNSISFGKDDYLFEKIEHAEFLKIYRAITYLTGIDPEPDSNIRIRRETKILVDYMFENFSQLENFEDKVDRIIDDGSFALVVKSAAEMEISTPKYGELTLDNFKPDYQDWVPMLLEGWKIFDSIILEEQERNPKITDRLHSMARMTMDKFPIQYVS